MAGNLLHRETSPYLLQHKDNPVAWRAWGPDAFTEARETNRPILLSVGYAACHWCHVMAHESFEDTATAQLMNELFVNIKVDREERPDVDTIYQTALQLLGEQGGWPLTMFLTPAGEPFWGGTYFPPEPRYGRPAFRQVLTAISEVYRNGGDKITHNVEALVGGLNKLAGGSNAATVPKLDDELRDRIAERILREFDPVNGGIGGAPKFPHVPHFELVWRAWLRTGTDATRAAVVHSLRQMCEGGIYDHLGGGFARYATDAAWLVPHFEKMLYDNAQLLDILVSVWAETKIQLFADRARETVGWVLREMITDEGAFAASLDADSEGHEGRFYVWTEAEIDAALGADAPLFKRAYDVSAGGNWEGKAILNRLHRPELSDEEAVTLASLRAKLLAVRETRVRPGRDDKVLADWNGLMIAALVEAGLVLGEPAWVAHAARAYDVVAGMRKDGHLYHAQRLGRLTGLGLLDDHAALARAALKLYEATGAERYLVDALALVASLDERFWDEERGGYFLTASDAENLIVRTRNAIDNATPSGNGVAAGVLARLYALTGEDAYRARAEATVNAFAGEIERNFFPLATLLNSAETLSHLQNVVIVGARDDAGTQALLRAVFSVSAPDRLVTTVAPDSDLPANHPATGKSVKDGRATAYVCTGPVCGPPVTEPGALAAALRPQRSRNLD
ncbi:MAG TPA: thioredoxin domain-containing protein [Alphaproteobacteria bacterium]|nr:thioredoxin domain-containing protein [Alphaproteobacteria bacterium]